MAGRRCKDKTRWRSQELAEQALAHLKITQALTPGRVRAAHPPIRTYPCPFCKGFHLTSQPRKGKPRQ